LVASANDVAYALGSDIVVIVVKAAATGQTAAECEPPGK